jgi:hypothetical protein
VLAILGLLAAAGARADVAVEAPASGRPPRCDYRDSAYWRDRELPAVKRAEALARGLDFIARSEHFLLFSSRWSRPERPRSMVVDAAGERVIAEFPVEPAAIVESAGGAFDGVVAIDRDENARALSYFGADGRVRWRARNDRWWYDSASVVRDGDRLYLALFHRIATGSALLAVDLRTGIPLWTADVEQLNVSHSKYFSDVVLEARGGELTLRGTEAGGCYLQRFDAQTGRRLSSRIFH